MSIDLYIGPVIARDGRFGYDTFSRQGGLRSSFRYQRVEEAHYDRRSMIVEAQRAANIRVHVCDTSLEFERSREASESRTDSGSDRAK
jgi:hypothetical protein